MLFVEDFVEDFVEFGRLYFPFNVLVHLDSGEVPVSKLKYAVCPFNVYVNLRKILHN